MNGPGKESWITELPTIPTITEAFEFTIGPERLFESCDPKPYVPPTPEEPAAEPVDNTPEIIRATTYLTISLATITIITLVLI